MTPLHRELIIVPDSGPFESWLTTTTHLTAWISELLADNEKAPPTPPPRVSNSWPCIKKRQ